MDLKKLNDAIAAARRVPYAPRELTLLAELIRDGFIELERRLNDQASKLAELASRNPPVL